MKKILFIVLNLIFISANVCFAQISMRPKGKSEMEIRPKTEIKTNNPEQQRSEDSQLKIQSSSKSGGKISQTRKTPTNTQTPIKEDTLYFKDIIRKDSWLTGVGEPLAKEKAEKLLNYYRFTMKNDCGHFLHIEVLSGGKVTNVPESILYYPVEYCNLSNPDLREDVDKIAQWFEYPDIDGNTLVEERSYDSEGNFLLSLHLNKRWDGKVIGTYYDAFGFPIDFDENENYTFGSVVCITYDAKGRDAIIDYYDGAGYSKPMRLGEYQTRFVYDDQDRISKKSYHNIVGDRINRLSGVSYTTLEFQADRIIATNFDKEGKPITAQDDKDILHNYMVREVRLDDDGNVSSMAFFSINENDEIVKAHIDNIHEIKRSFDSNSNAVIKLFDINGNEINE